MTFREPAQYEDAHDGAAGEDKEELVPRLLVKDVSKGWGKRCWIMDYTFVPLAKIVIIYL